MHPARLQVSIASITFVTELLTITGIAFLSNPSSLPEKSLQAGDSMVKGSLILMVLTTGLSAFLTGVIQYCCYAGSIRSPKVMRPLLFLWVSYGIVLGRTIFRLVQHFGNPVLGLESADGLGPSLREEWYFYVFDAGLLLASSVVWNVWHPRRYLPRSTTTYLAQDGKTDLKGPGWKDTRSLTETFLDPFASLTARGGHKKPFWEHNGYALKRRR